MTTSCCDNCSRRKLLTCYWIILVVSQTSYLYSLASSRQAFQLFSRVQASSRPFELFINFIHVDDSCWLLRIIVGPCAILALAVVSITCCTYCCPETNSPEDSGDIIHIVYRNVDSTPECSASVSTLTAILIQSTSSEWSVHHFCDETRLYIDRWYGEITGSALKGNPAWLPRIPE